MIIHSSIVFSSSIIKFVNITFNKADLNKIEWNNNEVVTVFVIIFSGVFLITILGLLLFHVYIITKNFTTNEFIRESNSKSLFDEGCAKNWGEVFNI